MSKYQFHRMSGDSFQQMVQALLEKRRRNFGELIQFTSVGADGAREATWRQFPGSPDYIRPPNESSDVPKFWVFQVKFHDIGLRGWAGAASAVIADLTSELDKVVVKYEIPCHHFVLITNVPLTGARRIGARDKITKIAEEWRSKIPNIEVWDAADLSRLLDDNEDVRSGYSELILPGDILSSLYRKLQFASDRRESVFRAYLKYIVDHESKARAEEAGDDNSLPLSKVFVDQTLELDKKNIPECFKEIVDGWSSESFENDDTNSVLPESLDNVSSSFPLLWAAQEKIMLLAGPGYGKSTITQFIALYHASRIINPQGAEGLASRLKLPLGWSGKTLDSICDIRFPFRIELRRYAKWCKTRVGQEQSVGIATYIAKQLIGGVIESNLSQDDVFELASSNPTLLILDGLDEVPNKEDRDSILKDLDAFLFRCSGEGVNLQIVMSSRPQGYNGEFDRFQPLRWRINDLGKEDFDLYCGCWLNERIRIPDERIEAEERIKRGMLSVAVRRLATTLLQATVMLTIVRRKNEIPEERHKLFEKYVDVVFEREKIKYDIITQYEKELRVLHEMVGYQIHEAIGRGESENMPETRFRDLVREVWCLLRGDMPFPGIINEELKRIYELSTDRLVFLSGKGDKQTDIDFVIQSYREYFAANYLSNHVQADPEKVFNCLVDRGAYWQNVLGFYAAIALPAQQLAWAYSAVCRRNCSLSVEELASIIKARRAALVTLSEYSRFQYEDFRRALTGILPQSEWSLWIGQEWIVPILKNIRSGGGWRELWKVFLEDRQVDTKANAFAIWFFPKVITNQEGEYAEFIEVFSRMLRDGHFTEKIISAVLSHELPISLVDVSDDVLFKVLNEARYYRQNRKKSISELLVEIVSRRQVIRFYCVNFSLGSWDDVKKFWDFVNIPVYFNQELLKFEDSGKISIKIRTPCWLAYGVQEGVRIDQGRETDTESEYERYLLYLFRALQDPFSEKKYLEALSFMEGLPDSVGWLLDCESVLGVAPKQFRSGEDWISFKKGVTEVFRNRDLLKDVEKIAATFGTEGELGNAWILLLFHPKHWGVIVEKGLLDFDFVEEVKLQSWAKILMLSSDFTELGAVSSYSLQVEKLDLPLVGIMRVAIEVNERDTLHDSSLGPLLLRIAKSSDISSENFGELIDGIADPSRFPETWGRVLLEIGLKVKSGSLEKLADFWFKFVGGKDGRVWIGLPQGGEQDINIIIGKLLEIKSEAALDFAMAIAEQWGNVDKDLALIIHKFAVCNLCNSETVFSRRSLLLNGAYCSRPTLEEIEMYADEVSFRRLSLYSDDNLYGVVSRILVSPQMLPKEHLPGLRSALIKILEQKDSRPLELVAAALDSLIQADVLNTKPLEEVDWKNAGGMHSGFAWESDIEG